MYTVNTSVCAVLCCCADVGGADAPWGVSRFLSSALVYPLLGEASPELTTQPSVLLGSSTRLLLLLPLLLLCRYWWR
jgi:hypothetical protein